MFAPQRCAEGPDRHVPATNAGRSRRALATAMTLLLLAVTPLALAQTTSKPKKKRATPAASASASASEAPADSAPPPAPEAPASAAPADAKAVVVTAPVSTEAVPNTPPDEKWDISDTREDSNKSYKFIGLRYRGTLIPRFIENLFVNEGGNFYSNSIGIEFDMRKGGSSTIPGSNTPTTIPATRSSGRKARPTSRATTRS